MDKRSNSHDFNKMSVWSDNMRLLSSFHLKTRHGSAGTIDASYVYDPAFYKKVG